MGQVIVVRMVPWHAVEELLALEQERAVRVMADAKDLLTLGFAQGAYKLAGRLRETGFERMQKEADGYGLSTGQETPARSLDAGR